jgi:hypothetical protein
MVGGKSARVRRQALVASVAASKPRHSTAATSWANRETTCSISSRTRASSSSGVGAVGGQGAVVADEEDVLDLPVADAVDLRDAVPHPGRDQLPLVHDPPDLLLRLAERLPETLAGPVVAADRRVEDQGVGVLVTTAALEGDDLAADGIQPDDPDVDRTVPVAVAVDLVAPLGPSGGGAVGADDVEELCGVLGGQREVVAAAGSPAGVVEATHRGSLRTRA